MVCPTAINLESVRGCNTMRIGLLGGTFDPIHKGHIHLANAIKHAMELDEVRLIPSYQTVHREKPIATPEQRLTMTKLACEDLKDIVCDDCEYKRADQSYTIETIRTFKKHHPNDQLYFIIGYDAFLTFTEWKGWQDILNNANLLVAKRPETKLANTSTNTLLNQRQENSEIIKRFSNGKISVLEIDALNISATDIRNKIKNNLDVSNILPISVYNFIKYEGIYAK